MCYMDSSALVKIYIREQGSEWTREVYGNSKANDILIYEIAGAEVLAALHQRFRNKDFSEEDLKTACDLFRNDFQNFFARLPIKKQIVDTGMRLIQKHPLRGYDAIQLATAVSFLEELRKLNGESLLFVGVDKVLDNSATAEGLTVINPSEYE